MTKQQLTLLVKKLAKSIKPEPHWCHVNSQRAALHFQQDDFPGVELCYVEGTFRKGSTFGLPPLAHAWTTIDGIIVDWTSPFPITTDPEKL